jgi:hypothetical protein
MKHGHMIGILLVGWACVRPAAAQFVDFDTPGDLATKFSVNASAVGNRYTQVAAGGLSNSGAVDLLNTLDADHTTAVSNQASYDFAQPGHTVTISAFVKRQNATQTQTPFVMLGILSDLTERMDAGAASFSYASIRLIPDAAALATDVSFQTETKLNGGGRVRVTPGLNATLTAGNWYRIEATFRMTSLADLLIGMTLEDWGPAGSAYQSTAMLFPPTLIALSGTDQVNGDPSVWAGFRIFHEGGADLLDNFSAVPEPSTFVLAGLAAALAARRRTNAG